MAAPAASCCFRRPWGRPPPPPLFSISSLPRPLAPPFFRSPSPHSPVPPFHVFRQRRRSFCLYVFNLQTLKTSLLLVLYSYSSRMYLCFTRMYSCVTRMYSYVLVCYSYVTRMYSCGVLVKILLSLVLF